MRRRIYELSSIAIWRGFQGKNAMEPAQNGDIGDLFVQPIHAAKLSRRRLRALVKTCQHKLAMPQRFGCREPPVGGAQHHLEQLVAGLIEHHVPLQ